MQVKRAKTLTAQKKKAINLHVKQRAAERYGVAITTEQIHTLERQIRTWSSEPVLSISKTRVIHKVDFEDNPMYVLYSKRQRKIVTVLTSEQLKHLTLPTRQNLEGAEAILDRELL